MDGGHLIRASSDQHLAGGVLLWQAKKALADLQTSQGSLACAEREAKEYKAATMALKARLKEINLKEQQLSEEVKELRACLSAKEAGPASTTTLERPVRELVDAAVADGTSSDHQVMFGCD